MNSPTSIPIRLLVIDDHTLFRRGLVALLASDPSLEVIGQAADAGEALRLATALQPDVILLDNHLPGVTGIQALPGLRDAAPRARVLMLTVSEDSEDLQAALRAGAHGYLLKTIEGEQLVDAIRRCMQGEVDDQPGNDRQAGGGLPDAQRAALQPRPTPCSLSEREHQVLEQIARGASNKEIARTLEIAETTVKIHVQHILRKLGLSSRVQAAGRGCARLTRIGAWSSRA